MIFLNTLYCIISHLVRIKMTMPSFHLCFLIDSRQETKRLRKQVRSSGVMLGIGVGDHALLPSAGTMVISPLRSTIAYLI
jgi:hypothetical protein